MLEWIRLESWSRGRQFCELAVDGNVLWSRSGALGQGRQPCAERNTYPTPAAAKAAMRARLRGLRKRCDDERAFSGPAPLESELSPASEPEPRWPSDEEQARREAFFAELRRVGIDPAVPFVEQARHAGQLDGSGARSRDAQARVSVTLKVARKVLGKKLGLTARQLHDGRSLSGAFPSPAQIFERIARTRS